MTDISLRRPDSDDGFLASAVVDWQSLQLPRFHESRRVVPDGAGWLAAAALEHAGFAYAGGLSDVSRATQPAHWSIAWTSFAPIPAAPLDGLLHYRFQVCGEFRAIAEATSLSLTGSLWFGVVGDSDTSSPFLVSGFDIPVATPVRAALTGPHARRLRAGGEHVVEGSVPVAADAIPSMAFVLGTDVLLQDGWAAIERGGVCRTWIEPVGSPGGVGSIEYRYEPHTVADAR